MKVQVLGLCGYSGSGRRTAASFLVEHAGFVALSFGEAVRSEVSTAFSVSPDLLADPAARDKPMDTLALGNCKSFGFAGAACIALEAAGRLKPGWLNAQRTPAEVLALWATDYRRRQDPAYWTRALSARLHHIAKHSDHSRFVVADVEQANEAATVKAHGGKLWRIARPGVGQGQHTDGAEFGLARTLINGGTTEMLRAQVVAAWFEETTGMGLERVVELMAEMLDGMGAAAGQEAAA